MIISKIKDFQIIKIFNVFVKIVLI